jgi:hypothetical protein
LTVPCARARAHAHTHTHTHTACVGSSPGGHNGRNIAQCCHVGSGCGSSGITQVSGGNGVDTDGSFDVDIFIGSDRYGDNFLLSYSVLLPTCFPSMLDF